MNEESIVWWSYMDDKYYVHVDRTGQYSAVLKIDTKENGVNLHSEETSLSYGAMFGPDVEDIQAWQERIVELVDSW